MRPQLLWSLRARDKVSFDSERHGAGIALPLNLIGSQQVVSANTGTGNHQQVYAHPRRRGGHPRLGTGRNTHQMVKLQMQATYPGNVAARGDDEKHSRVVLLRYITSIVSQFLTAVIGTFSLKKVMPPRVTGSA